MAKKMSFSAKHIELDKTNTQMVMVVAAASFITIFSLITAQGFFAQNAYKAKVIDAKAQANEQLEANIKAANGLAGSYETFANASTNVLGGAKDSQADNGGDNARIVLDALPSTYDFPALTSSIEKMLSAYKVTSITGIDDEVAQQATQASPVPQPVPIPFTFTVGDANYTSVRQMVEKLQNSIRPVQVDSMSLSGASDKMQVTINAHTYYQPEKNVNITKKVVK